MSETLAPNNGNRASDVVPSQVICSVDSPAPARVGEVRVVGFNQEKKIDKD